MTAPVAAEALAQAAMGLAAMAHARLSESGERYLWVAAGCGYFILAFWSVCSAAGAAR